MADGGPVIIDLQYHVDGTELKDSFNSLNRYVDRFVSQSTKELDSLGKQLENALDLAKKSNFKDATLNQGLADLYNQYNSTFEKISHDYEVLQQKLSESKSSKAPEVQSNLANSEMSATDKFVTDKVDFESGGSKPAASVASQAYQENLKTLDNLYNKLQKDVATYNKATTEGKPDSILDAKAQQANESFLKLKSNVTDLVTLINSAISLNINDDDAIAKLEVLKQKLLDLQEDAKNINPMTQDNNSKETENSNPKEPETLQEPEQPPEPLESSDNQKEDYKDISNSISEATKQAQLLKDIFNGIKGTIVGLVNSVRNIATSVSSMGETVKSKLSSEISNIFGTLNKGFKFFTKYVLGLRSTFFLIRKIRSMMLTGYSNLASGASEVQRELYMWKGALEAVKLSLGTIIQPIASALIPILKVATAYITELASKVASFFAILTGQKYIYKASSNLSDYADAEEKAADSANDAANAQKNQQASFDEMNVLEKDSSSSGSGSGIDYGDLISKEAVDMNSAVSDFAKLVKESWEKGDFTEVGHVIAEKLKEALNSIPWGPINQTAQKLATSLGTLINGFVETEGIGYTIGETIGKGFMTWVNACNTFFATVHWENIGRALNDGLKGLLDYIEPDALGQFLVNKVNAMFDVLGGFLENGATFQELGQKIGQTIMSAVEKFDWVGNAQTIGLLIIRAIETAIAAINEIKVDVIFNNIISAIQAFPWAEVGTKIGELFNSIDWAGIGKGLLGAAQALIGGLWEAIKNAVETSPGLGLAVAGVVVTKLFTGIVSLLTTAATGGYGQVIQQGVIDTVGKALLGAATTLGAGIATFFMPLIAGFEGLVGGIAAAFTGGGLATALDGVMIFGEGIVTFFTAPLTLAVGVVTAVVVALVQLWNESKTFRDNIVSIISGILEIVSTVVSTIASLVSSFITPIWQAIQKPLEQFWSAFKNALSGIIALISGLVKVLSPIVTTLTSVISAVLQPILTILGSLVGSVLGALITLLSSILNIVGDLGQGILDGIFNPLADFFGNIAKTVKGWVDNFVKAFKDMFGIHSPSKVMAEIGGFIVDGLFNGIVDAFKGVANWVKNNLFDPFWNAVTSLFKVVTSWFSNLFKDAKDGILKVFNWDNLKNTFTGIWSSIQDTFKTVKTWFNDLFKGAKEKITSVFNWTNLKKTFTDIWDGIKSVFKDTASWFEKTFSEAWTKVKNVFSTGGKVFDGIKDGIVSAFKTIVNALINGINKVVATPFKAINTALSTIKNVSILGVKPFSGLIHTIDIPKIPTLAQGAVIPANKEFLAILGDQKSGTNVEAPLDTIKQALAEVYAEIGANSNGQSTNLDITLQVGDRQLYRWIKKMENKDKMVFNG